MTVTIDSQTALSAAEAADGSADSAGQAYFPCSLSQERFWLLDQLDPGNAALNVPVRWQLDGELHATLEERAIAQVIARHELLRTSFVETGGRPMQRVSPNVPFRLACVDLSRLAEADRVAQLGRIGNAEARVPFQLAVAPLLRATLVRLSPERSILFVT